MLEIDNTPYPDPVPKRSKYQDLFESMKPGQSIKLDPPRSGSVAGAMRKWIDRSGKNHELRVSVVKSMPDGYARVYLLNRPLRMTNVPGRKIRNLGD